MLPPTVRHMYFTCTIAAIACATVVAAAMLAAGGCSSPKSQAPGAAQVAMADTFHVIMPDEAALYVTDFRGFEKKDTADPRRQAVADFLVRTTSSWPAGMKLQRVYAMGDEHREYYVFMTPRGMDDTVAIFFCDTADGQVRGAYRRAPQ